MAFDFLGTIESIEDFEAFEEFVLVEINKVGSRIKHLTSEIDRFDNLLDKYKIADLALRSDYKGSDQVDADYLITPRSVETVKPFNLDILNALDVDDLKKTFLDTIKYKRERNEFKIKRIRDLMEQMQNEINMLNIRKEDFQDKLDLIRGRFDLEDYPEVQRVKPLDPADVDEDIRAIPKDAGKTVIDDQVYYVIINIDAGQKIITFDYTAPPLSQGGQLTLSGGKNDGVVTMLGYKDSRTIYVHEELVTENPSDSLATIV